MIFDKEEIALLVELISNEQINMNKKNPESYCASKHRKLEELKVKIKDNENEQD